MTKQEFNDYLATVDLVCPHYNTFIKDAGFFEYPKDYYQLTHELIVKLLGAGWDGKLYQAKFKYSSFRFYTAGLTNEQQRIVKYYTELIEALHEELYKKFKV